MNDLSTHDVVIAGAGPVGLLLASELRLGGASVLVLEQSDTPASASKQLPFGMRGLSIPTVEALHRRGLLDAVRALQVRPAQTRGPGGHFAGIQFLQEKVETTQWPYYLAGHASTPLATTMSTIEAVLAAHAVNLGVEIRRGVEVTGCHASEEHVAVISASQTFHARWLVGCDGGRSMVRKAAGFAFAGTEPEFTGYSVEVELADPDKLVPGRQYTSTGVYTFQPPGTIAMLDFDAGAFHRSRAVAREHVQSVLRNVSGTDVTVTTLEFASTWTDRAFQAAQYRRGRVLLAGDAAHIHSPLGGQGLNLGMGDAMNLGWKLAATVRGDAPDGLVDTYAAERSPVAAQVLDWSRAQVGLMRPNASSRALGDIVRDLIQTQDGATYFAERIWGATLRHDLGDGHPLVGRSVPDFKFSEGRSLADCFRTGKGVLLEFGSDSLRTLATAWKDRIAYASESANEQFGLSAVLARPDGVVAWASDGAPSDEPLALAISRWFGGPLPMHQ